MNINAKNTLLFLSLISAIFVIRQVELDIKFSPEDLIKNIQLQRANRQLQTSTKPQSVKANYCSADQVTAISQSQIDQQAKIFESINKQRGGNSNENLLAKALLDSSYTSYGQELIKFSAPWAILALISLIGWNCYCLCCCCDCCCPPSKCCRRDLEKKPFTTMELTWPNICQIIFGTCLIAFGIVSLVFNTDLKNGLNNFRCSGITFVDDLLFGKTSSNSTWIGIYPVQDRLDSINTQVKQSSSQFTATFQNTEWLNTATDKLNSLVSNLYTNHYQKTVSSPNPSSSGSNVDSYFIKTKLGPLSAKDTMTYALDQEFKTKTKAYIDIVNQLKDNSKTLTASTDSIVASINSGKTQVQTYTGQVNDYYTTMVDFLKSSDIIFFGIVNFFYGYWGATLFSAVFSILGAILVQFCKMEKCRFLLHVSWCFACILMIIGFLLSTVWFPLTIIMFDFCNLYHGMLVTVSEFNKYDRIISTDVSKNLNTCLFGSGDIAAQFGMSTALEQVNNVSVQFDKLNSFNNNPNSNINSTLTTVTTWIATIESYRIGSTQDSVAANDDNAWNVLTTLNQNTDSTASGTQQSSCGTKTQDKWVFTSDGTNCQGKSLVSNSSVNSNFGQSSCLEVGYMSSSDVSNRYNSLSSGCSIAYSNINKYYGSLKNYDNSRRTLFDAIKNDLYTLNQENSNLNAKLSTFQKDISSLQTNVQSLLDNIGHPKTGIANSFNCKFMMDDLINFEQSLCVSFMVPMYYMLVFIIVGSILMFFNSCFSYTAAMRHSKKHKVKVNKQTYLPGDTEMSKLNV